MTLAIYFCIILFTVTNSVTVKFYNRSGGSSLFFNTTKSLTATVLMLIMCMGNFSFHPETLLFGTCYGAALTISTYAGYKALCLGPMSLTSLIVSFSVTFPLLYGIFFCHEKLTVFKTAGLAFLVLAIIASNLGKAQKEKSFDKKWFLFVATTFVSNGICSVLQAMHQRAYPGKYASEFMLYAMLLCSLIFLITASLRIKPADIRTIRGKAFPFVAGIANVLANLLTTVLAGAENASVLFPAITAGTIFANLVCGVALFREKLRTGHHLAIFSGIAAVVLLKL